MTPEKLADIVRRHGLWLRREPGGVRADLSGADLSRADLSGADLSGADLSGANFSGANFSRAYLSGANLYRTNLSGANLSGANLYRTNLSGANLYRTNLSGANLYGANLYGANLYGANLYGAVNSAVTLAHTEIVPREGSVIGWKKCRGGVLVKVEVPAAAARSNATGRKCRAEYVVTLAVFDPRDPFASSAISSRDDTTYRVGEITRCDKWNPDRWVECTGGIHFFLTREEAEDY